jgi:hypothetical protein
MTDGQLPPPDSPTPGAENGTPWWKKRRAKLPTWAWIAIGFGVVVIGAAAAGGGADDDNAGVATTTEADAVSVTSVAVETTEAATTTEATSTTEATTTTTESTTTTTTIPERDGSRANPFDLRADAEGGPDMLSSDRIAMLLLLNVRPGDFNAILEANQFNDPAPAGKAYWAMSHVVTVADSVTEPVSGYEVQCSLVGDLGTIYEPAFLSDVDGNLGLLDEQPDAIGGGTLAGDAYYLVTDGDTNLRAYCDGIFVIPG